jgi:uncharacterized protein YqeY
MTMLFEKIENDIKDAMRAKDVEKLETLRAIKSAFMNSKTEKNATPYTEEKELLILQKLVKEKNESIEFAVKADRPGTWEKEKKSLYLIKQYLPKPVTKEDLLSYARVYINEGAFVQKDMGLIIKNMNFHFLGRANGGEIASIVKQVLSEPREH